MLRAFGADYPPSREREEAFFRTTPRIELQQLAFFEPAGFMELIAAAGMSGRFENQGLVDNQRGLVIARRG